MTYYRLITYGYPQYVCKEHAKKYEVGVIGGRNYTPSKVKQRSFEPPVCKDCEHEALQEAYGKP